MTDYYSKDSLNEFGFYKVYKEDFNNPLLELSMEKLYVNALLNNLERLYYDKHGNFDSLVNTINRPVFEKVKIVSNNVYKRKNKLKYITTNHSRDSVAFKYNFFGQLKAIEFYKDSKAHKVLRYKKNLLVSEQIFESKRFKKTLRNKYNKNRQLIRKDIDDNYFHRYLYENDLLIKKEKVRKRDNIITAYTLFTYGTNGLIISKKEYQDEELKEEYIYKYE
ncbi:hypothetical protein H2O64_21675 [Kordia sp. YSTF-M3]|uniref:Uncharacterized protein n=1 Tax=Kordia aestuariivivens TaxID=2759037 RepID=A0ABR7QFE0_9FLAO|nr:hypothetical protein [Kordia aestuariivivens]MBC8757295.1 hypothetical protein [Kordia aestuariivivens]